MYNFSIFNIKIATQKLTDFDKFSWNSCWYDSGHNTILQNYFKDIKDN